MEYYITSSGILPRDEYLAHHGILGMKWGVRRFQNTDGTLTPAGRERYHRMIADNVTKDRLRAQRAVINPAERVGLSYKLRNRHRNKIQKEIQEEFENTPEGARLKKANDKLAKIQQRMNNRDASLNQQNLLGSVVNRIGQNADFNRYSEALAEQNEAQKAAAKAYDKILKEYSEDILDATIKDLKIYEIDDGREFLEKYLRGDDDATFSKVSKKQERAEIRELKKQKQEADNSKSEFEYIDKIKTKNGGVRYVYDEDEVVKSYNYLKSEENKSAASMSKAEKKKHDDAKSVLIDTAINIAEKSELKSILNQAKQANDKLDAEYEKWQKSDKAANVNKGADQDTMSWYRYTQSDPKLKKMSDTVDSLYDEYRAVAKKVADNYTSNNDLANRLAVEIEDRYYDWLNW